MLPAKIKAFNAFIDGIGYAGEVEEIEPPKLARKMEEHRSGGMDSPVKIDLGGEAMESTLTLSGIVIALFKKYGACSVDGISIRLKGSAETDDTCQMMPVEIVMRGRIDELDMGTWKAGDSNTNKFKFALSYYKVIINLETVIEIDVPNMKFIIDGEDRFIARRLALGML